MVRRGGDRALGLAVGALGVAAAAWGLGLPEGTETGGPGTRFLPVTLGALLAVLGGAVALAPPAGAAPGPSAAARGGAARVAGTLVALAVYTVAFEPLGFLVATTLGLAGLLVVFGERRPLVVAAVAVVATGATYALFGLWLKVPLPKGVLGP